MLMVTNLLAGAKLVQGERRAKRKTQFLRFALPSRRLSYVKLVQGERRAKRKTQFLGFALPSRRLSYVKVFYCCPVKVFSDREIDGYGTPVSGVSAGKIKTGINPLRWMQNVSCEPWTLYPSENPSSKLGCFQTATSSPCRVLHPAQGDKQNKKPCPL